MTLLAQSLPSLAGPDVEQYKLTKTGIVFNRSLTNQEYEALGRRLAVVVNATPWQLGDWLVAGTGRYDEAGVTYLQVHELTGRSYETIKDYLRVALSYSHHERGLVPWTHYREALRLPATERMSMLRVAQGNSWTRTAFVDFINTRLSGDDGPIKPDAGGLIKPGDGRRARHYGAREVTCPHCHRTFAVAGQGRQYRSERSE